MKLYVGNINFQTTEAQLQNYFEQVGPVRKVTLVMDKETQRPKGFGFVEMDDSVAAKSVIAALGGRDFQGRALNIQEAREREHTARGGFSRDRRG